jgi:curved DNA-binding protein CbpA
MVNHFARFALRPVPWIDAEVLKARFLELSAKAHPDKAADKVQAEAEFKELNEAYTVLRNPRTRLLHLLELHGVGKQEHVQAVPAEVMKFFAEIAAVTQQAEAIIKQKAVANSPMLKVQMMEQGLEVIDRMQGVQGRLRSTITEIEQRLEAAAETWPDQPDSSSLQALSTAAAALGFLERWSAQLQERIGALTF